MKLIPYKHPVLGWYFDWKLVRLINGCFYIHQFAIRWSKLQPIRWKPTLIPGRTWIDGDHEPNMYIWLKFNISFSNGWGIGLDYK